jgi:hypothetical protein
MAASIIESQWQSKKIGLDGISFLRLAAALVRFFAGVFRRIVGVGNGHAGGCANKRLVIIEVDFEGITSRALPHCQVSLRPELLSILQCALNAPLPREHDQLAGHCTLGEVGILLRKLPPTLPRSDYSVVGTEP